MVWINRSCINRNPGVDSNGELLFGGARCVCKKCLLERQTGQRPKNKKIYDIKFPWYVKLIAGFLKPRLTPEIRESLDTIRKYKNIGKKKYRFDYDYDIKKKKFKAEIKIIF